MRMVPWGAPLLAEFLSSTGVRLPLDIENNEHKIVIRKRSKMEGDKSSRDREREKRREREETPQSPSAGLAAAPTAPTRQ
jgi:hypothetical protein